MTRATLGTPGPLGPPDGGLTVLVVDGSSGQAHGPLGAVRALAAAGHEVHLAHAGPAWVAARSRPVTRRVRGAGRRGAGFRRCRAEPAARRALRRLPARRQRRRAGCARLAGSGPGGQGPAPRADGRGRRPGTGVHRLRHRRRAARGGRRPAVPAGGQARPQRGTDVLGLPGRVRRRPRAAPRFRRPGGGRTLARGGAARDQWRGPPGPAPGRRPPALRADLARRLRGGLRRHHHRSRRVGGARGPAGCWRATTASSSVSRSAESSTTSTRGSSARCCSPSARA